MKKNIFGLSLCAIALSGLMMVSCETETVYEVADVPSLTVSSAVTVSYDGGNYTCTYTLSNPETDGYVTCSADVSWISDVTDNNGTVGFTVAANTTDALRNGNITVAYNYSGGYISKTVGVIQSAYEAPALTVQPTAVTAAYGGGSYSFTYSVENAADDGELTCSTDATWVGSFDYSTYGTVSFTVDANSGEELRDCEIAVKYSYNSGSASVSKTVAVVQDHQGSGSNGGGDVSEFVGTYTCSGISLNMDAFDDEGYYIEGVPEGAQNTWTMKIYDDGNGGLILSGLVPDIVDYYPETSAYIAQASVSGSSILVYPQYTGYTYQSYYYIWWILCPVYYATDADAAADGYDDAGFYYSDSTSYPCTFSSTGTDTWTSDYGLFLALNTSRTSISSSFSMFDVFAPGLVITKTSSSTSSLTTTSAITHSIDEKLIFHKDFLLAK